MGIPHDQAGLLDGKKKSGHQMYDIPPTTLNSHVSPHFALIAPDTFLRTLSATISKDCAGLWPFSTSRFAPLSAPLKFAEFHNHSPLLTMGYMGRITLNRGGCTLDVDKVHRCVKMCQVQLK